MSNEQELQLNQGLGDLTESEVKLLFQLIGSALTGKTTIEVQKDETDLYESLLAKDYLVNNTTGTSLTNKIADIICGSVFLLALSEEDETEKQKLDKFDDDFEKMHERLANAISDTSTATADNAGTNDANLASVQSSGSESINGQSADNTAAATQESTSSSETGNEGNLPASTDQPTDLSSGATDSSTSTNENTAVSNPTTGVTFDQPADNTPAAETDTANEATPQTEEATTDAAQSAQPGII